MANKGKKRGILIISICIVIMIACIIYIAIHQISKSQNENIYESLKETVEDPELEIPIDFETLQTDINPDIYAWIRIPDTEIDYPVAQSEDDDTYYLDYTIENVKGYPGSIYTEMKNSKDFSDFNTVIYGHNMGDGTMFGNLKLFRDSEYLSEHPEITIYTEESILTYKIFAVVTFSDRHILNTYNYETDEGKNEFLTDIYNVRDFDSQILTEIPVTTEDKILTLSTCIKYQRNDRLIIGAVLVDEQK